MPLVAWGSEMKQTHRLFVLGLIVALLLASAAVFFLRRQPALYTVTVLPSLGGKGMAAHALNDSGQIVGLAQTRDGRYHFFLWERQTGLQDLGPGEARLDINNAGRIAGTVEDANGNPQAFRRDPQVGIALLGTLGGRASAAAAINNRGQVVGRSETAGGSWHAFLWDEAHGMRDLGTLGGAESEARAINDAGAVFGLADTPQQQFCPFVWDPNGGTAAVPSPAEYAMFNSLNNGCWVAGLYPVPREGGYLVLWSRERGLRKLCRLDPYRVREDPLLLNDANQIVFSESHHGRLDRVLNRLVAPRWPCYVWDPNRGKIALDPCLRHGSRRFFWPLDINNKGAIVGALYAKDMVRASAVLLEPIPERWKK